MKITKIAGKYQLKVSSTDWCMIGWRNGWITTANATPQQKKIIALFLGENPFDKGTGQPAMWDKQKENGSQWTYHDIADPKQHFNIVNDSYKNNPELKGAVMKQDEYWKRVKNAGWDFYGDKAQTGWITARDCGQDGWPGVMKLTGSSGSKEGMMAGMSKLMAGGAPIWGAMTPNLWETAMKVSRGQLKALPVEQLKMLLQYAPPSIWGYSAPGKDALQPDGSIAIHNPGVGKTTSKKFICNDAFIAFLNKMAQEKMQQMMGKKKF